MHVKFAKEFVSVFCCYLFIVKLHCLYTLLFAVISLSDAVFVVVFSVRFGWWRFWRACVRAAVSSVTTW